MKILYLTQYFPPDRGAAGIRAFDTARGLAKAGHQVTILTEFPNYPSGVVPSRYRFSLFQRQKQEGIDTIRTYVKSHPDRSFVNRMLFYLSFCLSSVVASFKLEKRYDIVYATSPPLSVALSGYLISRLKGSRFVFEVRDLWPECAVALGALKGKAAASLSQRLADFCYRKADKIVAVTRGIQERLTERLEGGKLCMIRNGIDLRIISHGQAKPLGKAELGCDGKLIVLYAGLLGLAQGVETIIETAKLLRHRPRVHFLVIGDGPQKGKLVEMQRVDELRNIQIMDEMPRSEVIRYVGLADCCLVPLRKVNIFKTALPSKMLEAWACGKPIILSADGEAREHLQKAKGGIWAEPEDAQGIADAIECLLDNPNLCQQYGGNGRRYVERHFSRSLQIRELEKILLGLRRPF